MTRQLTLIESKSRWHVDAETREIARRGLAEARAVLAAHRPAEFPGRDNKPRSTDTAA
ncbi:MAG: hypothetical protein ABI239_10915 [Aquihabitans sp.]